MRLDANDVPFPRDLPKREATIGMERLPNGYWRGTLRITTAVSQHEASSDLLHDAGDVLRWAELEMKNHLAAVSPTYSWWSEQAHGFRVQP